MDANTIRRGQSVWNAARDTRGEIYDWGKGMRNAFIGGVLGIVGGPLGVLAGAAAGAMSGFTGNYLMTPFSQDVLETRRTITAVQDMPRNGGKVESGGCVSEFPRDTFNRTARVEQLTMFGDGMCPPDFTPVTRMVDLKSDQMPQREIKAQLEAFRVPSGNENVEATLMHIPQGNEKWQILETVWLSSSAVVRFTSKNISRVIAVVSDAKLHLLRYRIKSFLYSDNRNNFSFLFFHYHSVIAKEVESGMKQRDYKMLFDFDVFKASSKDNIEAILETDPCDKFDFKPNSTLQFDIDDKFRLSYNKKQFDVSLEPRDPPPPLTLHVEATIKLNKRIQGEKKRANYLWKERDATEARSSGAGAGMNQTFHINTIQAQGSATLGAIAGIHKYKQQGGIQGEKKRANYLWKERDLSPRIKSANTARFRSVGEFFPASKNPVIKSSANVDAYIDRLQSVPKHEMLALFRQIHELSAEAKSKIAQSIRNPNFSGSTLSLSDVYQIGSIINFSKQLDLVNFHCCKLQPGALQTLKNVLTNNIKIDKLQVTGNPGLMLSDFCRGVDLCAQNGCQFVYDIAHLSKKDRQTLKSYIEKYQPQDEMKPEGIPKTRQLLVKEQRFQKRYKRSSSKKARFQRLSLTFEAIAEVDTSNLPNINLQYEPNIEAAGNLHAEEKKAVKVSLNKQEDSTAESQSNADSKLDPQAMLESPKVSLNKQDDSTAESQSNADSKLDPQAMLESPKNVVPTSGKKKRTGPRTLGEYMKLKPIIRFDKAMKSLNEEQESPTESRTMLLQKLKIMALKSDGRRFESVALKSDTNLRRYIRNSWREASTVYVESNKVDSGYGTRSSFMDALSCKPNRRRYTRTTEKHVYDPNILMQQKLEMTVLGLGPMQKRSDMIQSWVKGAEFDERPTDQTSHELNHGLIEEFASRLSALIIGELVKEEDVSSTLNVVNSIVEELIQQVELTIALSESCKRKSYKTEKIGPEGGSIDLYGCEILIPPGAVKKRTDVRISVDINPDNFPKFAIAISPIFGCKPSRFRVPVRVRLTTWFSARDGKRIWVKIMSKRNFRARWNEIQEVLLDEGNMVEYKVKHFCGQVSTIPNESADKGVFRLFNDVWMHSQTANITSFFCKDEKALKKTKDELKTDHKHIISPCDEISARLGNAISIELPCRRPPPPPLTMKMESIDGKDGRLEISSKNLKKVQCFLKFRPNPHPDDMPDVKLYDVRYHAEVYDSNKQLVNGGFSTALDFYWPVDPTTTQRNVYPPEHQSTMTAQGPVTNQFFAPVDLSSSFPRSAVGHVVMPAAQMTVTRHGTSENYHVKGQSTPAPSGRAQQVNTHGGLTTQNDVPVGPREQIANNSQELRRRNLPQQPHENNEIGGSTVSNEIADTRTQAQNHSSAFVAAATAIITLIFVIFVLFLLTVNGMMKWTNT